MQTASVVTYHSDKDELLRLLQLLSGEDLKRIWVIDNGREDSIRRLCDGFEKVEYIPSQNLGYGAGHNIALNKSAEIGAKYHAVLNSDIDFAPGAMNILTEYMDSNADVGLAQPRLVDCEGNDQYSCRRLPTPLDLIIRRFLPKSWFKKRREEYLLTYLNHDTEHNIPYHQGSFMFIRMDAIADCGGFDERFFMYPEDIDLTRRVHRKWRTMYVPRPVVTHFHRAESYKSLRMSFVHAANIIRYFNKWGWLHDNERSRFNNRLKQTVQD